MFRNVVGAIAVLVLSLGVVLGDELKGRIVKISNESVSFQTFNKDTNKYEDAKSYPLIKDAKFFQMVKDQKEALEGGVKASVFRDIDPAKGVMAVILTADNKVTEVRVKKAK
jgi:hypothetical protein